MGSNKVIWTWIKHSMKNKLEILIIVGDVNQFVADYGSLNWVCVMPDPFPTEIFKPSNKIINKIANLIQIFQPLWHTEK